MLHQIRLFLTALTFLTRIPVPWNFGWDPQWLHDSIRFFPVVGLLVGGLASLVLFGLSTILPTDLALLLSMAFSLYLTGAFHEDGFADMCDGFGGGYTAEKALAIMKDSRLGTYGTAGLAGMLATKFLALHHLPLGVMLWALPMAHAVSRVTPVWFMASAKYVRDEAGAKSKPMGHKVNVGTVVWVTLWALAGIALAFVLLHSLIVAAVLTGLVLSGFVVVRRLAMRKIGGFTGDILGAMQQVTEVLLYVGLAACLQS